MSERADRVWAAVGTIVWAIMIVSYFALALLAPAMALGQLWSLLTGESTAPVTKQTTVALTFLALLTVAAWIYILHGRSRARDTPRTRYIYMNVLPVLVLAWVGCHALVSTGPSRGHWVALGLGVLLIIMAFAWWRWKVTRRPAWHCRVCGYDLTGNVSGHCSECGTSVCKYPGDPK